MAFRKKSAFRGKSAKRQTQWYDNILSDTVASATQIGIDLTQNLPQQSLKGTTVIRMLVNIQVRPSAANSQDPVSWGITMVDEDAFAAAALPDTNDETEQPGWMLRGASLVSTSNANDGSQFLQIRNDLSGQRKFAGNSSRLVFLFSNDGVTSVILNGMIRMLVKKP